MGPSLETTIEYKYQMVNNINEISMENKAAQEELQSTIKDTTKDMNSQTLDFVENVLIVQSLASGITALSSAFDVLGILNDKQLERLNKMVAVTRLFTGSAQAILGLVGVVKLLRNAEIALAAVETYRKVLHNPASFPLVLAGIGAASLVTGLLIGRSTAGGGGGGDVNQVVNFNTQTNPFERRAAARSALDGVGA
jgi:hypothetical protein